MYHELEMDGSSQTEHDAHLPDDDGARPSFPGQRGEGPHPAERPGQHEQAFSHFDQDDEEEATQIDHEAFEVADLPTEIAADFPQNPVLLCTKGKDSGKDFTLQNGTNSVGRSLDNDIILSDVSVSRRHFALSWDGQVAKIRDLGSGNGTQLNGSRVHEAALEDNDVVSAGETEFRYRTPEGVLGRDATSGAGAITAPSSQMGAAPPVPGGFAAPPAPGGFAAPPGPGGFAGSPGAGSFAAPPTPAASISTKPKDRYQGPSPLANVRAALGDKVWLVVGGAVILLIGAIITTFTYVKRVRQQEELASQNAAVEEAFQRGVVAFQKRDFSEAHRAFDAVLRVRPSHEQAREAMRQASQAKDDQQKLIEARNALLDGDVRMAQEIAESVDRNSKFARDFSELRIEMKRVDALRSQEAVLQAAVREGDLETAERAFDEVRRLGADEDALSAYKTAMDTLSAAEGGEDEADEASDSRAARRQSAEQSRSRTTSRPTSSAPRRVVRKSEPRPTRSSGGSSNRRAISLYAAGRFEDAAKAASPDLAGDIRAFETYYKKSSGAPSRRNMSSLREAVRLDKKISGGKFASRLKPKLVEALLDDAKYRLSKKDDARGCARVKEAKTHDPSHGETGRLERLCSGRAIGLAKRAKSLERSDPKQARDLYRQVLAMGPDSSLRRQVMDSLRRMQRSSSRDDDE